MKLRLTIILLLALGFFRLSAQDHYFRHYGTADGLNNSFLYAINQDKEGYLWVGTGEGLYRFNGFEFQHFTDQDSLAENFITTIYRDLSGSLWLGHKSGGITQVSNNRFRIIIEASAFNSAITSITEADSGTIWFSTQNEGLMVLYSDHNAAQISTNLENDPIFVIRHISENIFLVGTQENLYVMEYLKDSGAMSEQLRVSDYPPSKVVDIIKEKEGEYLIASQDEGIFRLSIDIDDLSCDLNEISNNQNGDLDNVQGARKVNMNELWVYTAGNGITKYYRDNESGEYLYSGNINNTNGLISNNVKCLFEDLEGNVWLGMFGEGLLRLVDDNLKFYSYLNIGSNRIFSLSSDSNYIWLAGEKSITRVDPDGGVVRKSYPFPVSLTGVKLNSIYYSHSGLIYLGFEKKGLFTLNPINGRFVQINLSKDDLENSVNKITGKGNTIWIGTQKGVCKLNPLTGSRKWFNTDNGLPHNNIQILYIDSKDRVLIGTICRNIFFIDENDNVVPLEITNSLGLNSVISLTEDNSGSLWVATQGNGVYKFKDERNNWNYTRASGLLSDYCYSLAFDGRNKILVGHRGGFSQIDTEANRLKSYARYEGIKSSSEFYPNAVLVDNQKNIWFGTSEGVVKFLPQLTTKGLTPPVLHIDAVYVNKEKINFDDIISLSPGYYEIEVEYTGINFSNPELVNYQTFLEEYNTKWSGLSNSRMVAYEKVGHGEYTFMVRAFNENDIPTKEPVTFKLRIKKPFYASIWFYLAILIVLVTTIYLYIRRRERHMRTTQEMLIKNLDEKTKEIIVKEEIIKERKKVEKVLIEAKEKAELSDKLKSSFLTNMSHEIRTPMNAIVGLSELLKMPGYSEEERTEFVEMILTNSNSLISLIDDILDISKIESNQLKVNLKSCVVYTLLEDLHKRFSEEIIAREKSHIEFRFSMEMADKDITIETDGIRLKQVLSKLLDNAIKFTDSGSITLGYKKTADNVIFFVEDSGIGLSEDKKEIIFELFREVEDNKLRLYRGTGLGLSLSQNLVKLMGGEIKVESEVDKGSRFYFSLPIQNAVIATEHISIQADNNNENTSWSAMTIFVIEDEISNFMLIREILKPSGASIISAEDGFEAVEKFSTGTKADIIIMDIKLPGIDGYEVTRRIRKIDNEIPIIALTAYAMEGDHEKSIEAGCNDYITKPLDRKRFLNILGKYLNK
ncbi:MAG TPA: ATP-binding protein [Bacteroidales bacterium]|nr:ATP-binding protein [Bacteroidales bacterium]